MKNSKNVFIGFLILIIILLCIIGKDSEDKLEESQYAETYEDFLEVKENYDETDEEKLVGTWDLQSGSTNATPIRFYSDGTLTLDDEEGKWGLEDDSIRILGKFGGQFWDHDNIIGDYELNDNTLTITNATVDGRKYDGKIIYVKE